MKAVGVDTARAQGQNGAPGPDAISRSFVPFKLCLNIQAELLPWLPRSNF